MIPFTEGLRYKYALTPASLCIDVGAYHGSWAKTIHEATGCRVDAYEPVNAFFMKTRETLKPFDKIRLYPHGVAAKSGNQKIHVQNDSSGAFATSAEVETCSMLGIFTVLKIANVAVVDVLKLNCEGGEYAILEELLGGDDPHKLAIPPISRIRNLQVQMHTCAPDWQNRYDAIASDLSQTHELTWREPFVWENWQLKK